MTRQDPNLAQLQVIAAAIGELRDQLVFVGGCAAGLLITDQAAAPVRATYDVDLIVQAAALRDYHLFERKFESRGFARDMTADAPICRWRFRDIAVDLMPVDSSTLGFSNRWYPLAVTSATSVLLPGELRIRLIQAPVFIATKFEAFADRGAGDLLGSHDLEDIINVIDGRGELPKEVRQSSRELQNYLAEKCAGLLNTTGFIELLPGMIFPDETLANRVNLVTHRLHELAGKNE